MPATYSINVGTAIEAYRKADIITVLKDLPDNTHKLISPKDVRDAFISTWAASPFKQTTNSTGIEYIGIDSGNPANRDIKQRILIGKRTYANRDIMTDQLLSEQGADIYFYNTKPDSYLTQSSTKIAILAGTSSSLHLSAPYIESSVSGTTNNLEIRNPSLNRGPISIYSPSGRVAINGILFPTVAENAAGASNGKILKYSGSYPNGYFKWSEITVDQTNVGTPGQVTNIYGSPIRLNGYSMEFVDNSIVPQKVGGIPSGFSFSSNSFYNPVGATHQNWPLSEVLREIIYPYVDPEIKLSVINNNTSQVTAYGTTYAEAGGSVNIQISYEITIYPRNEQEYVSNCLLLSNESYANITSATISYQSQGYSGLSFSGLPGTKFTNFFNLMASSSGGVSGGKVSYTMAISNVPGTSEAGYPLVSPYINMGWSYSATTEINFIMPIYYGFIASSSISSIASSGLEKLIRPYPGPSASIGLSAQGSGYLYFSYPVQNGIGGNTLLSSLKRIKDANGFLVHSSVEEEFSAFTYSTSQGYHIYRTIHPCSYTGDDKFEFIF